MAVGYTKENEILIANSSEAAATDGVQLVDIESILRALFFNSAPTDLTWGTDRFEDCAGYVVVG